MFAGSAIKRTIKASQDWTQAKLATALGLNTQGMLASRLAQKNLSINLAHEMLEPLGYEIVFRPKDPASDKPSYVITLDDSDSTIPAAPVKSEDAALEAKVEALVARYMEKLNGGDSK